MYISSHFGDVDVQSVGASESEGSLSTQTKQTKAPVLLRPPLTCLPLPSPHPRCHQYILYLWWVLCGSLYSVCLDVVGLLQTPPNFACSVCVCACCGFAFLYIFLVGGSVGEEKRVDHSKAEGGRRPSGSPALRLCR